MSLRFSSVPAGAALVALLPACFNPPEDPLVEDGSSTAAATDDAPDVTSTGVGSSESTASPAESSSTGPSVVDEGSTSSTSIVVTESSGSESTTGSECGDDELSCDGECVDPMADDRYCGAQGDCQGSNAGAICMLSAVCNAGACTETCDDCGFESGTLAAWVTLDLTTPYIALAVQPAGAAPGGAQFSAQPTEGMYALMNGFDGNGGDGTGSTIEVGQDISLSAASVPVLLLDYQLSWNNNGMLARTFEVLVEPAGGGAPFETVLVASANAGTNSMIPPSTHPLDLSAYAGETVFVRFVWTVPETFTGPGTAQLDHVRIEDMP
jgi:hypothetical protein